MRISASIYSDKKRELKETVLDLKAHQVDMLHIDCNDDLSVFEDVEKIRAWCKLPIDLHIITETPERYFKLLEEYPVEYVTFQYEQLNEKLKIPGRIKSKKGLAITTPTSLKVFDSYTDFDFILFMATTPGKSGGTFDAENFKKIREFKKKYPNKDVHVDGGVNGEVSFILRNMGVNTSVSGSFLFKNVSVGQALMDLTKRNIQSQFKISDFMIPLNECPVIDFENISFKEVLNVIEHGKQGLTIVTKDQQFFGIISNADVRKTLIKNFDDLPDLDVSKMINKNPVVINAEANVDEMLYIVRQQSMPIMYLPVIDKNNIAKGIVSFINLIKGEI